MDLNTILKKTKSKSARIKRNREPVYIATAERPYEISTIKSIQREQKEAKKKLRQTRDKVETNLGQTRDKLKTNLRQNMVGFKPNLGQTRDKVETQLRTQLETKLRQTRDKIKIDIEGHKSFFSLIGLQRKTLLYIYNQCKLCRDKITSPLSIENVANHCNTSISSERKTLQRLEKKGYIIRKEFKNGRGGWTRYELEKDIFQEIFHCENNNQFEINLGQTRDKVETQLRTQLRTNVPSSSSYININNKTTTTELPSNWLEIELSNVSQFGFTKNHLWQLFRTGEHEPHIISESIEHFLFDLAHNHKAKDIKTNALSYFMGILTRVGVYAAPENYESPKDRAMRLYLEKKQVQQEKKATMEKECQQIAFQEWQDSLEDSEKEKLIPEAAKKMQIAGPKIAALRAHFENIIWPQKKNKMLEAIVGCA